MATNMIDSIKNAIVSLSLTQKIAIAVAGVAVAGGAVGGAIGIAQHNAKEKTTEPIENTSALVQEYETEKTPEELITEETTLTQNNFVATPADFKLLTDFISDFMHYTDRYNYKSRDAREIAFASLMSSHFTNIVYDNFFSDYKEIHAHNDPLGKFSMQKGFDRYYVFPGKSMDWIITNVFNLTPDHNYVSYEAYYKDGNYYVGLSPSGGDGFENTVINSTLTKDNVYEITLKNEFFGMGEDTAVVSYYYVKAALRSDNGKKYWSLYEMRKTSSSSAEEIEADATNSPATAKPVKAEGWKKAYNQYLKSVYDEIVINEGYWTTENMFFSFAYVDADDIPELLIVEGTHNAAQVKFITYKNNRVIELGKFGSMGYASYVEKGSVIFSGYYKHGHVTEVYYKLNSNNTVSEIFRSFSNAASGEPIVYKINDVEVTKEEFERESAKMPQNLKTCEHSYNFIYENFDIYC